MSDDLIKALQKEAREDAEIITRLRADRAAVTEERDRMREALERIDGMATTICMRADAGYGMTVETVMPIYETARAALEGVTEPASPKAETEFFVFDEFAPLPEPAKGDSNA